MGAGVGKSRFGYRYLAALHTASATLRRNAPDLRRPARFATGQAFYERTFKVTQCLKANNWLVSDKLGDATLNGRVETKARKSVRAVHVER
jgi:hypothetical protein